MNDFNSKIEFLVESLHEIGALKFGEFVLKSGIKSPVYCDLRLLVSYPQLMKLTSDLLVELIRLKNIEYDIIAGVPFGAIAIAAVVSVNANMPMILKRKEVKSYGTKKAIEGVYKQNDRCLIIEDVTTSGSSIVETYESLNEHGILVNDSIVILDREQGASQNINKYNIKLHSLLTLSSALDVLLKKQKVSNEIYNETKLFISQAMVNTATPPSKSAE